MPHTTPACPQCTLENSYPEEWQVLNVMSTLGATVLGVTGGIPLFAGISGFDSVALSWRIVVTAELIGWSEF